MYDAAFVESIINGTARLAGLPVSRLSATAVEEAVERADSLFDVELLVSERTDAERHDGARTAEEAAQRLVAYGKARLSYELLLPISRVELIGDEVDERTPNGTEVLLELLSRWYVVALPVVLTATCLCLCCRRMRRPPASQRRRPRGFKTRLADSSGGGGAVEIRRGSRRTGSSINAIAERTPLRRDSLSERS
jgi:hypothetical protein